MILEVKEPPSVSESSNRAVSEYNSEIPRANLTDRTLEAVSFLNSSSMDKDTGAVKGGKQGPDGE